MIYISSADIPGSAITDKIEALVSVGVNCIELSGGSSYYSHHRILSDLVRLQKKYSLKYLLHNYFPPPEDDFVFNLASDDQHIIEKSMAHAQTALNFSKELGAEKIAFHSGFLVDAGTNELDRLFIKRTVQNRDEASKVFMQNVSNLQQNAGKIKLYFENNVITAANLQVYDNVNPFLLCDFSDYQKLSTLFPFNALLDVAHLKISAATLKKDFQSELDSFLAVTDYIHFSQNDSVNDLNLLFEEADPLWQKIKAKKTNTITLEIKGELNTIGQLYSRLRNTYERHKLTCDISATFLQTLRVIKDNGKGIAFITDNDGILKGILTDGDIRSVILSGVELDSPISEYINRSFVFAYHTEPIEKILKKIDERITIIPLVDKSMKFIDYVEFSRQLYVPVATPELSGNELKYLTEAFLSTWISSQGKYIEEFEKNFANYSDTKFGVAVSNGTTALHLALLALDIGPGDEVIVPDLTFAATINCVLHANAKPVIVDVERSSWCIDPVEIEKAVTPKTKAIIPVHLYGQPANMKAIQLIAKKYKLKIIEDAAEAHGATFSGKKVGSFGDISCFSFYGNKVITTGEGGMCVTNSIRLANKMKKLRDHGMSKTKKYWHDVVGYNYRMTNLQAAIGLAQLERIESIQKKRQELEKRYISILQTSPILEFQRTDLPLRSKITWLVSVLVKSKKRDALIKQLKKKNIDSRPFFYPLSIMPLYKKYVFSNTVSKILSRQGINFPTTTETSEQVISTIKKTLKELE